jgi:glycosyltransferase involved in cell wall biosynthesis
MKVFYSHDIFAEQEYGGVSRYFTEIIKKISLESDVDVVSGLYFNKYLSHLNAPCKITGKKIDKINTNKYVVKFINEVFQASHLKLEIGSIFHQTYYSPFPINKNLQVVVTVHDMVHELFPEIFHKTNITSYSKKKSCERADRIIAVSESTKKDLIDLFKVNPDKIEVIYHGSSFCEQFADIEPYKHQSPYILFVGSRKLYKNFNQLLKVFKASAKLAQNFNLVCFGGGQFTKEERAQIYDYKLENIVHQKSGSDLILAQFYAGARALVYPSLYEGFGIPVLEAMSMNCPVICSNQSSLPEVALDAAIYFNPNDTENIQYVLEEFLLNDSFLKKISIEGLERHKIFTWEKTARKTLDLYKSILK